MKTALLALTLIALSSPAMAAGLANLERDGEGKMIALNQIEAAKYCADKGQRLYTARELAEQVFAKPVREVSMETENNRGQLFREGYFAFLTEKNGQLTPQFYFNPSSYTAPEGEDAATWAAEYGAILIGKSGIISGFHSQAVTGGVRCKTTARQASHEEAAHEAASAL